ncbi:MAG: VIT domain-containing protein [Nannocystaceae bacterium]
MSILLPLPRLRVPLNPSESPVELVELKVSAEISGGLAVTTWELVFLNPNRRDLEGSLEFPLLDGQAVIRFAMDMDGGLREAVPVPKDKGRQVFEDITRQGVDPGLLERTAGNNYRARVYPLVPGARKRVIIAYQEALADATYRLGLAFEAPLPSFSFALRVRGAEVEPVVARDSLGLALPAWREDFVVEVERENFRAQGVLEVAIPPSERPALTTERRGERTYFRAEQRLRPRTRPRRDPRVLGLLWDCSGSAEARDHARELAALEAYLEALRGPVEVRLIRLRDVPEAAEVFRIVGADASALRRALERALFDGASSLTGVAADPEVDAWLLVSDGLLNYGPTQRDDAAFAAGAPVHVLMAATRGDPTRLRDLAARSGGAFVDLLKASADDAVLRLTHEHERILAIETSPRELSHVFPEAPAPLPGDGRVVLTGVLRGDRATLRARLGFADDDRDSREIEVELRGDAHPGSLAGRAWATAKIAALEPRFADNRADIERVGQEFGIVTRATSLIILDSVDDYIRYDIEPPPSLRGAWAERRQRTWADRQRSEGERRESLARLFAAYTDWYDRDFEPRPAKPKPMKAARPGPRGFEERPRAARRESSLDLGGAVEDADCEVFAEAPLELADDSFADAPAAAPAPAPAASAPPRMDAMEMEEAADGEVERKAEGAAQAGPRSTIRLQKWTPDAPYLDRLRRTPDARLYHVYHEERPDYARSTAFFLDVADVFFARGMPALGLRILSNLAEMELENPAVLRILGYRLLQAERADLARPVFEAVRALRPEEPQSHRDLAHACAALGDLQAAVDLLWQVALGDWDRRFPEIELLALVELNAIAAAAGDAVDVAAIDPRLLRKMPLDLRVVLTWDADNTDIDLWVTDPRGEKAYYGNRLTAQGGRMTPDFREGYGPEAFSLRRALPGEYLVEANYYGNSQQIIAGATTIQLQFITGFATPGARDQRVTMRLRDARDVVTVGRFTVGE